MIRYFRQALDNTMPGSPAYVENLERMFIQDHGSGLIEVETGPDSQLVIPFSEGQRVGCFLLSGEHCQVILPDVIQGLLGAEATVRSLELPSQAVRAVLQSLEWFPGQSLGSVREGELEAYFGTLRNGYSDGVMALCSEGVDGFATFADGMAVTGEIVLATPRGFGDSLAIFNGQKNQEIQLTWYAMKPETETALAFTLRLALMNWVIDFVQAYQVMVGYNLINALNYDVNTAVRLRRWNMRMVGAALFNHHYFEQRAAACEAYAFVLKRMFDHTARVVGGGLARKALDDSFHKLRSDRQKVLEEAALNPARLGGD